MKTLKSTITLALAAAALAIGLAACDQVGAIVPTIKFNSEDYAKATTATFVLPPQTKAGPFEKDTVIQTEYVLEAIKKAGYSLDNFKSIKLTAANLVIINKNTTFDPLTYALVSVGGAGNTATASLQNWAKNAQTKLPLTLEPGTSDVNLLELFKKDDITVLVALETSAPIEEKTEMRLDYQLDIVPN